MRKIYLLLAIFLLIISCYDNGIDSGRYVVLNYDQESMDWIFEDGKPTQLTLQEIREVDEIVQPRIGKLLSRRKYYKQYVPIINSKGEKHIYINYFCGTPSNERWKSKIMYVLDGGECYFNIKVDLSNRIFYDYWVNGIAEIQPLHNSVHNPLLGFVKN